MHLEVFFLVFLPRVFHSCPQRNASAEDVPRPAEEDPYANEDREIGRERHDFGMHASRGRITGRWAAAVHGKQILEGGHVRSDAGKHAGLAGVGLVLPGLYVVPAGALLLLQQPFVPHALYGTHSAQGVHLFLSEVLFIWPHFCRLASDDVPQLSEHAARQAGAEVLVLSAEHGLAALLRAEVDPLRPTEV